LVGYYERKQRFERMQVTMGESSDCIDNSSDKSAIEEA
jgi:hypothetical protein